MASGPKIIPTGVGEPITQEVLDKLNVSQQMEQNKEELTRLGQIEGLAAGLGVDLSTGLTDSQYHGLCQKFGTNTFPEKPMTSFFALFFQALNDFTIMILIASAIVSLCLGIFVENNPNSGWIEGTAILIAVLIVATVTAGNDYTKELQFRALEKSSQADEQCTVFRERAKKLVNPSELTVGDIVVLQVGDGIPADGIIIDQGVVTSNESALTGEAEPLQKRASGDPFLLSSCTITDGEEVRMLVIGIGAHSQWGRIRANLVEEANETPLQSKLADMAKTIGYMGSMCAVLTFIVLLIYLFVHNEPLAHGVVEAFIIAITVIVVAIPEGLPLAVTISLAYSTRQMYHDQNLIRVLAACETMGNATNICSDKTGTLTENRMTVVEGWFADVNLDQDRFKDVDCISSVTKTAIAEHVCINRLAYIVTNDPRGQPLVRPEVVGNATEGALLLMARSWGHDYEDVFSKLFNKGRDKIFPFSSKKKRSTAVVHRSDGSVRVYCKGAPEWVLRDCVSYTTQRGEEAVLTPAVRQSLDDHIKGMAHRALRTLCLAHRDFRSANDLPENWHEIPPDSSDLVCDAIVGIIDPLRDDVKDAVAKAQSAGVTVRMVTGDNINTACAIARQCGILTEHGIALEGPQFRNMTPKEVDEVLPRLQVLARSSPDDKFLLVTRLNGQGMPSNKEEWEEKHPGYSWEKDRDRLLPGYKQEWEAARPDGGHVVGVTGDGTNDAPALKAADVGLSMGITGTRVAKDASDIVILDDRFSSIVRAIMWGRSVYDNIRKFLQFQLTVNVVACSIVFLAAVAGFTPPLNAVMMLWVNLIMDTMGALALGTEQPTLALLQRKPYKRSAFMLSKPMIRHIMVQAVFQLALLLTFLFAGAKFFNVEQGSVKHNTIIFNTFVFCQVFNELNARSLTNEWAVCKNLHRSPVLIIINIITVLCQIAIVELGGPFTKTVGLSLDQWLITIAFGAIALPVGILMRYFPAEEDPNSFFHGEIVSDKLVEHKSEGNGFQVTTLEKEVDMA